MKTLDPNEPSVSIPKLVKVHWFADDAEMLDAVSIVPSRATTNVQLLQLVGSLIMIVPMGALIVRLRMAAVCICKTAWLVPENKDAPTLTQEFMELHDKLTSWPVELTLPQYWQLPVTNSDCFKKKVMARYTVIDRTWIAEFTTTENVDASAAEGSNITSSAMDGRASPPRRNARELGRYSLIATGCSFSSLAR